MFSKLYQSLWTAHLSSGRDLQIETAVMANNPIIQLALDF
jgi:hypothetical protein